MRKLVFPQAKWQEKFNRDVANAYKTFPIKEEHFGQKFKCKVDEYGTPNTFTIYAIAPKGRIWHVWARSSMGGIEYKFNKPICASTEGN